MATRGLIAFEVPRALPACEDMDRAFAIWNTVSPCGDKAFAEFDLILVLLGSMQLCDGRDFAVWEGAFLRYQI